MPAAPAEAAAVGELAEDADAAEVAAATDGAPAAECVAVFMSPGVEFD